MLQIKYSAPMDQAKTQIVQIKIMEAKISKRCPGHTSSMSKLLWESKQEDEDRLKQILSKILRAWDTNIHSLPPPENVLFMLTGFSTKVITCMYVNR